MSLLVRVFCRSEEKLTRRQLAQWVVDGAFFDEEPRFSPPPESAEAAAPEWSSLELHWEAGRPPIRFEREPMAPALLAQVEEDLGQEAIKPRERDRLAAARQVFLLRGDDSDLSDDALDMLDTIEHFLASDLDGLIWVRGEGLLDANLQPLTR